MCYESEKPFRVCGITTFSSVAFLCFFHGIKTNAQCGPRTSQSSTQTENKRSAGNKDIMESNYSTVSSFSSGTASAAFVNALNGDVGKTMEAGSEKMTVEGNDGRVMIRGDAATNCDKPNSIEPPLRASSGPADSSERSEECFAGEYVPQDASTILAISIGAATSTSSSSVFKAEAEIEQQINEAGNVVVCQSEDTPMYKTVEYQNGSVERNGFKENEQFVHKENACISHQTLETTANEADTIKYVTDEPEGPSKNAVNGTPATENCLLVDIAKASHTFENESIGQFERDKAMGAPYNADDFQPNGILNRSDAFAECNSNMEMHLHPTHGEGDDSMGELLPMKNVTTAQGKGNCYEDDHNGENGAAVSVNVEDGYCNGGIDEVGQEQPLEDKFENEIMFDVVKSDSVNLAEEAVFGHAGIAAPTKDEGVDRLGFSDDSNVEAATEEAKGNNGKENTQEDEHFGSSEAVENDDQNVDDEFGEFDEANDEANIHDDEFGDFDDGGAGNSLAGKATGGFTDGREEDVRGPSFAENPNHNLAMNLNSKDPILAKVHTVFSKLFPSPCNSVDAVDDDSSETTTLEALLQGLNNVMVSEETTSFDLSALKSRLNEYQSTRRIEETENNNIAVFGHDRNPYISTLKARDSRLIRSGGFSIGWSPSELESSSEMSNADIAREIERLAKLIPDLSYMLSDRLCLPKQL